MTDYWRLSHHRHHLKRHGPGLSSSACAAATRFTNALRLIVNTDSVKNGYKFGIATHLFWPTCSGSDHDRKPVSISTSYFPDLLSYHRLPHQERFFLLTRSLKPCPNMPKPYGQRGRPHDNCFWNDEHTFKHLHGTATAA